MCFDHEATGTTNTKFFEGDLASRTFHKGVNFYVYLSGNPPCKGTPY